jgi:hypothetical protein
LQSATPNTLDPLDKVRPLVTELQNAFVRLLSPGQFVVIDEATAPFTGRVKFIQYNPMKPHKWGYKIWCACDSITGFLCQFDVYTGAQVKGTPEKGLAARVVMNLARAFANSSRTLVFDNYYSTIALGRQLLTEMKLDMVATLRQARICKDTCSQT